MKAYPVTGAKILRKPLSEQVWTSVQVEVVRDLSSYQKVTTLRAITYMSEQDCPYSEEFDGNDLNATHLLATVQGEPVATLRIRWFSGFGKIERVCVIPSHRGGPVVKMLLAHTMELAARKGYPRMLAQIQARLADMWLHVLHSSLRKNREAFTFSGFEYLELEMIVPRHPEPISIDTDPYVVIRPEGDWDRPGVLEDENPMTDQPAKAA